MEVKMLKTGEKPHVCSQHGCKKPATFTLVIEPQEVGLGQVRRHADAWFCDDCAEEMAHMILGAIGR